MQRPPELVPIPECGVKASECSVKALESCCILAKFSRKNSQNFDESFEIRERCKGVLNHFFSSGDSIRVHCVDLGESFPTSIYLQNLASIQPITSPLKFARSPRTDRLGPCRSAETCSLNDIFSNNV